MYELGKKDEIFGVELLREVQGIYGRPTSMPRLGKDDKVICGYDQGLGERMIVCESLADMQQLYDAYHQGGALQIHWYVGPDPGFIYVIPGQPQQSTPDKPDEMVLKEADVNAFHVAVWYKREKSLLHILVTFRQTKEVLEQELPTPTTIKDLPSPRFIDKDRSDPDAVMKAIFRLVREINQEEVAQDNAPVLK